MKIRSILATLGACSLLIGLVGCATTTNYSPNGAIATLNNLPAHYRYSVTKVYADTAVPIPPGWEVYARNYNEEDKIYLVTVKNGWMRQEAPAPAAETRAAIKNPYPINRKQVLVDSDGAWDAAAKYCESKGAKLIDARMSLHQKNAASAPIWTVKCYDVNSNYIGTVVISAQTGQVVGN